MKLSLLAAAAETPERTALVVDGESLTYAEVADRVRRRLAALEAVGSPRVALVGRSDLPTLLALYGLFELGRGVLLLHPRSTRRERERLIAACGIGEEIDPASLAEGPAADPPRVEDDERCLTIVATSGSSGPAKGVVLSRRAFVASAEASAANLGWRDGDRWLLSLPVAHVGGLSILTRCLAARRTVVVHPLESFAADEVVSVVERFAVTILSLVPTMLKRLLERHPTWTPPAGLRAILVGGAAVPPALAEEALQRGWPVLKTYGLTEACSQVATWPYGEPSKATDGCTPLPGLEVQIREGSIELRGPQLMTGYLPELEEPAFTADDWLRTGDLGRLDEAGRLHVLGRRDEVIVTGGENVAPGEVERVLEEHPGIAAAAVFGVEDEEWGEAVAAALVASGEEVSAEELRRHLDARLARYKVPRWMAYVPELSRLPSGKVDRKGTAGRVRGRLRPTQQPTQG